MARPTRAKFVNWGRNREKDVWTSLCFRGRMYISRELDISSLSFEYFRYVAGSWLIRGCVNAYIEATLLLAGMAM